MTDWTFSARWPDGRVQRVTFYARTWNEASKLARGWATRVGCVLDETGEKAAA